MNFQDFGLCDPILHALQSEGYTNPTPIQQAAIPILLQGKDLIGVAQTGTGKTAAFSLPLLQRLAQSRPAYSGPRYVRALILTPTRELAIQIGESIGTYGKSLGLNHTVIFGGVSQFNQVQALNRGVDILIATPGRLLDLIGQRHVSLKHLSNFILDEADRMLDMGFIHDVKKIIGHLPRQRQTMLFSATMPTEIQKLATSILTNPEKVEVTPVSSTADTIEQSLYYVDKANKKNLLIHVLQDPEIRNALVFTRTKHGADKVVKDLVNAGITAMAIHGNKSQNARQRALTEFKEGKIRTLIATDIAARGLDIDELSHVINYELPNIPESYVHRIGRTGRAGMSGKAIAFCEREEFPFLKDIQKLIRRQVPVENNHPYPIKGMPAVSAPTSNHTNEARNGNKRFAGKSAGNRNSRKRHSAVV